MMRHALAVVVALAVAGPVLAETTVASGSGAVRVLDKITGQVQDVELASGESVVIGYISVTMGECRYPADNPAGDAFVQLVILDSRETDPVFTGWMVASAPALNPFDHPRYDVWALRCDIPDSAVPVLSLEETPEEAPPE